MALRETNSELNELTKSVAEAIEHAEDAGLRHVSDRSPGFTRKRLKKNFAYLDQNGKKIQDPKHLNRIKLMVIPPAWEKVWICPTANGHIQATGRDQRGRKQYIYHSEWRKTRDTNKYERMIEFGLKLPALRKRIQSDLKRQGLPREKVLAAILLVMDQTLIRVGNDEYAKTNKSYGLTTFRNQHVKVKGDRVKFHFTGKSGKVHDIELEDPRVAKVVRKCQDLPGQELFSYYDDSKKAVDVTSADVNAYLKEAVGDFFTAKDFRTWGGSVKALSCFLDLSTCAEDELTKAMINQAYKDTAAFLGNTVAVCKKSYIHPAVIKNFESGKLRGLKAPKKTSSRTALNPQEHLFIRLLKSK